MSFFKTIRKHVFLALPKPLRSYVLRIIGKRDLSLRNLNKLLKLSNYGYRATYADSFNLITRMGVGFLDSEQFLSADLRARQVTGQIRSLWTTHVLLWAAECGARLPGDFVECGVEKGFGAHAIVKYLNFPQLQDKTFYLLDSWEGGDMKNLAAEEEVWADPKWNEQFTGFYDEVKKSFDKFNNVTLIKGFLPGSLAKHSWDRISFLHIDLNFANPEAEVIRFFWPKMTKGAVIVLDDYNHPGREVQKTTMDNLGKELGFSVLSLPTGQGLVVE